MPAGFTKTDVERMAVLAHLVLSDEETSVFGGQLAAVLRYAGQVRDLDTSGVAATAHVPAREAVDRPDQEQPSLPQAEALANAPDAGAGLFKVPRVLG
jgi:aspartyl-tRNA(Asn)/glutamyl-tRNA(Gln) amidotransferase subunit C